MVIDTMTDVQLNRFIRLTREVRVHFSQRAAAGASTCPQCGAAHSLVGSHMTGLCLDCIREELAALRAACAV